MSGMDAVGAILLTGGLVLTATVVEVVIRQGARGDLGRNGVAGIRTRATRTSDQAWTAAHQTALPQISRAGWVSAPISVAGVIITLIGGPSIIGTALSVGGFALYIVLLLAATLTADRAARAVGPDS